MSDLISREAVKTAIKDYMKSLIDKHIFDVDVVDCAKGISEAVDSVPIAFDVDEVVEQLETYKKIMQSNMESSGHDGMSAEYYRGRKVATTDFLEIVKGAVKECTEK